MSDGFDAAGAAARALGEDVAPDDGESGDTPEEVAPVDQDGTVDDGERAPSRATSAREFRDWLLEGASRSHSDVDATEWLDLDGGGRNRLALVVSDWVDSKYPPRIAQVVLGVLEEAFAFVDDPRDTDTESSGGESERLDSVAGLDVEGV